MAELHLHPPSRPGDPLRFLSLKPKCLFCAQNRFYDPLSRVKSLVQPRGKLKCGHIGTPSKDGWELAISDLFPGITSRPANEAYPNGILMYPQRGTERGLD